MVPTRIGLRRKSRPGASSLSEYLQFSDEFEGDISDAGHPRPDAGPSPSPSPPHSSARNGYAAVADDEDPLDGDIGGEGSRDEALTTGLAPASNDALLEGDEEADIAARQEETVGSDSVDSETVGNGPRGAGSQNPCVGQRAGALASLKQRFLSRTLGMCRLVRFVWVLHGGADEMPAAGTRAHKAAMAVFYLELPFTIARCAARMR
jgi:hypothetical protein